MQIKSNALLYLANMFINKLKTKFNRVFSQNCFKYKRIHNSFWRNFPTRAKEMPSKVLFVGKKNATAIRLWRAQIVIVGNS